MEAEALYYQCCERIDNDTEVAELFLIGCIAYLKRDKGEKGVRKFILDDLKYCNYEPYLRELRLLSVMHDDSMQALITSSIDLAPILKQITIIYEHAKDADYELVQPSTHANKAVKIADIATKLADNMKPTTRIKTDSSLFSEEV